MIEVTFVHKHSEERIIDLLCAGLEGGIFYWSTVSLGGGNDWYDIKNPEWKIIIDDIEQDVKGLELNFEKLKTGFNIMSKNFVNHYKNFLEEDEDAITGDVFVQCCLFKDVIYG